MIIKPIFFYMLQVCNGIRVMAITLGTITLLIASVALFVIALDDWIEDDTKKSIIEKSKKLIACGLLAFVIGIVVPSKTTMMEMMIANTATEENIDNVVTYIIEKVEEFEGRDEID